MSVQPAASLFGDDEPGDGIPRHARDGRPKIWPAGVKPGAVGTRGEFYIRASSLGSCLEDGYGIHLAHTRKVVFGIGRSVGLFDRAQAVATLEDTRLLDDIVEEAGRLGGDGEAAMSGTALHLLSERADRGDDLAYLDERMRTAVEAWRHLISHFAIHGTEQFVVNDELKAAGSYDRLVSPLGIMLAPDGTAIGPDDRIGVDLKSGKSAEYFGVQYRVQQRVYFGEGAVPYSHEHGRGEWPDGIAPRHDWSLIPHVPLIDPSQARLKWVDLSQGAIEARLALEVRERRKDKGMPDAELPAVQVAPTLRAVPDEPVIVLGEERSQHGAAVAEGGPLVRELVDLIRAADGEAACAALYAAHKDRWTPYLTAVVRRHLAGPA